MFGCKFLSATIYEGTEPVRTIYFYDSGYPMDVKRAKARSRDEMVAAAEEHRHARSDQICPDLDQTRQEDPKTKESVWERFSRLDPSIFESNYKDD